MRWLGCPPLAGDAMMRDVRTMLADLDAKHAAWREPRERKEELAHEREQRHLPDSFRRSACRPTSTRRTKSAAASSTCKA